MRTCHVLATVTITVLALAGAANAEEDAASTANRDTGFTTLVGGGLVGVAGSDRPTLEPGAYIGSGQAAQITLGYQFRTKPDALSSRGLIGRFGVTYLGASHTYRDGEGTVWASRYLAVFDILWDTGSIRIGPRMGMGLGFGSLGGAYEQDHGEERSFLGLDVQLGALLEVPISHKVWAGLDLSFIAEGAPGEQLDQSGNAPAPEDDPGLQMSIVGVATAYVGVLF